MCISNPRTAIFTTASSYRRHLNQHHSPTPPPPHTTSTLSIATDAFSTSTSSTRLQHNWERALSFISTNYPVHPPNFRHTWLHFLKNRHAANFSQLQANLLQAIVTSHAANTPSCDPAPFWWLFLHLELLILHPTSSTKRDGESIQSTIAERIISFQNGHIEDLWTSAMSIVSKPKSTAPPTTVGFNRAAQHAADNDNWRTAYQLTCNNLPVATIDPSNEGLIHKLYTDPYPSLHSTDTAPPPLSPHQQFNLPGDICESIKSLPKGKANGIIADSIEAFSRLVRLNNESINSNLRIFFNLIFTNRIPTVIGPYLRDTYLFCLHKDPNDSNKLRPIGVPTAIRRILGNHIARSFRLRFAEHLLPHNFAVGIPNGQDFLIKTTQLAIDKYITAPQSQGRTPTRAVVFTDMTNMFNLISREELRECLRRHFPELLQVADLLYLHPGTVHFQHQAGDWFNLQMREGVNQGCPLSSIFAALVFHRVLAPLQAELDERAASRVAAGDSGDDGFGSVSIVSAFMDDNTNVIPHNKWDWSRAPSPIGCLLAKAGCSNTTQFNLRYSF